MLTIEQVTGDSQHIIELYQCFEREWDDVEPLAATKNGKFVPTPIIASLDGQLVGGLVFTRFLSPITQQQAIWINALFIKPEHRRQGISSRLIQHAEQLIQVMNEPELLVFAQIPALYSRLGWKVVETVDDHFVLKSTSM